MRTLRFSLANVPKTILRNGIVCRLVNTRVCVDVLLTTYRDFCKLAIFGT